MLHQVPFFLSYTCTYFNFWYVLKIIYGYVFNVRVIFVEHTTFILIFDILFMVCLLYHLRACVQGIYSVFYFGVYYFMGMPSNTIYEFVFKKGILCLGMSPLILHHFNFQNIVRVIFFRTQYVHFILVYYLRVCLQYHLRVCLQDIYVFYF